MYASVGLHGIGSLRLWLIEGPTAMNLSTVMDLTTLIISLTHHRRTAWTYSQWWAYSPWCSYSLQAHSHRPIHSDGPIHSNEPIHHDALIYCRPTVMNLVTVMDLSTVMNLIHSNGPITAMNLSAMMLSLSTGSIATDWSLWKHEPK